MKFFDALLNVYGADLIFYFQLFSLFLLKSQSQKVRAFISIYRYYSWIVKESVS